MTTSQPYIHFSHANRRWLLSRLTDLQNEIRDAGADVKGSLISEFRDTLEALRKCDVAMGIRW